MSYSAFEKIMGGVFLAGLTTCWMITVGRAADIVLGTTVFRQIGLLISGSIVVYFMPLIDAHRPEEMWVGIGALIATGACVALTNS